MTNDSNWSQPPKQPQGYWDQGAAARAQEAATFRYWNSELLSSGKKYPY